MDFATVDGVVQVHQHSYIDNLQPLHMQAARAIQRDAPLNETEKEQPDVMFDTCSVASNI